MTDPRIILTRGIPGSGKTAWATEMVKVHDDLIRVSRDDIRMSLFGTYHGGNIDEDLVSKVETESVKAGLKAGKTVIVDATHLPQRYINRWQRLGYPVDIEEFPAPLDELLFRNARREKSVPENVIRKMFRKFARDESGTLMKVTISPEYYETSKFEEYVPTGFKPEAFLFDIDGTLAHMNGGRSPYDYSKVSQDKVDPVVRDVLLQLSDSYHIVIVSGRKAECREDTLDWLNNNYISPAGLFMREDGDDRPDSIIKYEILTRDIAPNYDVLGVFDDRNSVVDMWRNVGLKCFQVQPGDF